MNNTLSVNEKLVLCYPDGFHEMDENEKGALQFFGGDGKCIKDPERHILITIGVKTLGAISSLLINAEEAAKKAESSVRKPMEQFGYIRGGFITKDIGGEKAEGFCYEYKSQGINMSGETFCVKQGKTLYYFNIYFRSDLKDESEKIIYEIISSVRFL